MFLLWDIRQCGPGWIKEKLHLIICFLPHSVYLSKATLQSGYNKELDIAIMLCSFFLCTEADIHCLLNILNWYKLNHADLRALERWWSTKDRSMCHRPGNIWIKSHLLWTHWISSGKSLSLSFSPLSKKSMPLQEILWSDLLLPSLTLRSSYSIVQFVSTLCYQGRRTLNILPYIVPPIEILSLPMTTARGKEDPLEWG